MSQVNRPVAAKPPIPRRKEPADDELAKWREFSRQMTAAYEDMKTKYQASVKARDQDAKVIAALQEQIKNLKLLLMRTHRDKEDLGLVAKQTEETKRRGSSKAESNIECSYLAELIINLRTDLDKAHSDVVKLRRSDSSFTRLRVSSSPVSNSRSSKRRRSVDL
jgi:hypothetical protein